MKGCERRRDLVRTALDDFFQVGDPPLVPVLGGCWREEANVDQDVDGTDVLLAGKRPLRRCHDAFLDGRLIPRSHPSLSQMPAPYAPRRTTGNPAFRPPRSRRRSTWRFV